MALTRDLCVQQSLEHRQIDRSGRNGTVAPVLSEAGISGLLNAERPLDCDDDLLDRGADAHGVEVSGLAWFNRGMPGRHHRLLWSGARGAGARIAARRPRMRGVAANWGFVAPWRGRARKCIGHVGGQPYRVRPWLFLCGRPGATTVREHLLARAGKEREHGVGELIAFCSHFWPNSLHRDGCGARKSLFMIQKGLSGLAAPPAVRNRARVCFCSTVVSTPCE